MKYFYFPIVSTIALLSLIPGYANAQEKPILESDPYNYTKESFQGFIAEKDGMVYVLKEKKENGRKTTFLQKMSKSDLKLISFVPLVKSLLLVLKLPQKDSF